MDKELLRIDRMKYTKNKASSNLAYLAILFNVLYFVSIYSTNISYYYSINMGASVVYNLLFLLATFLCSEGVKGYKLSYAIAIIAIGAMQIVRIFKIPLEASRTVAVVSGVERAVMETGQLVYVIILLCLSAAACVASGVICVLRERSLTYYLEATEQNEG